MTREQVQRSPGMLHLLVVCLYDTHHTLQRACACVCVRAAEAFVQSALLDALCWLLERLLSCLAVTSIHAAQILSLSSTPVRFNTKMTTVESGGHQRLLA